VIWLILFIVFLIIEVLTINLVTIWFAIGSLAAFISTYFTDSLIIQCIVFVIFTALTLLITKPVLNKFRIIRNEGLNYDRIIGKIGVVTKKVSKQESGRVKVDGKDWMAISDKEIEVNKEVEILKIDGVKLIVKEKE